MDDGYAQLFQTPVAYRIVEVRTPFIDRLIHQRGLTRVQSVVCQPQKNCVPDRCFVNVDRIVEERGGAIVTGWMFNEFQRRTLNGVAHAIWQNRSGQWIDVTPHEFQPKRLLFARDPTVAAKRGYTAAPKLLLSENPYLIAIEHFESNIAKLQEEKFVGFDLPMEFSSQELEDAAREARLSVEVAKYIFDCRMHGRPTR